MSATATQGQAERAELEAVLNSGIFSRSPILATFLQYVCNRYFEGDTDGLKEYCIAVEALKRPPDFDQKKDAIVRVEAHRLRKRLSDYYQRDGAGHTIRIEIPNGQYGPRFVCANQSELSSASDSLTEDNRPVLEEGLQLSSATDVLEHQQPEEAVPAAAPEGSQQFRYKGWAWGAVAVACGIAVLAIVASRREKTSVISPAPPNTPEVWKGSASPVPSEFRMLAGYHGSTFTDRQGRAWVADAYYSGGTSVALPNHQTFQGLPDPDFASSQRVGGEFEYSIPVNPGTYEVVLHFLEARAGDPEGPGVKLLSVMLNGKTVLDHIDPLSDAGAPRRLTSRVLSNVTAAADGRIHLRFVQNGTTAELVALEVLSSAPGHVRPIRIVAASHSVTDENGVRWMADEDCVGGTAIERDGIVNDGVLRAIYVGERYGNFSYHIPLPPGKYRVSLYFAESYFTEKVQKDGTQDGFPGRLFNVYADGVTLLRNFNVMKEAGGSHRAVVKTFEGLEPNAQGKIVLEFVPVVNYAEINAIEVTQMN